MSNNHNYIEGKLEEFQEKFCEIQDYNEDTGGILVIKQIAKFPTDWIKQTLTAYHEHLIGEVMPWVEHDNQCILSMYEGGRPTEDGGYENKVNGKWYSLRPIDNTPKCDCGLNDIITKLQAKK